MFYSAGAEHFCLNLKPQLLFRTPYVERRLDSERKQLIIKLNKATSTEEI